MKGKILSFLCSVVAGSSLIAQEVSWPPEIFKTPPTTRQADGLSVPGLESIFYEGFPVGGQPTDVFGYIGLPKGAVPPGGWPAVVLVHGGGGTAFPQAVQYWNQKGFAAIAMDLEGHLPDLKVKFDKRPPTPHPAPSRFPGAAFGDLNEPIETQWPYHAIAEIIKARRLLAARPEVNPGKIGIVGWSWGGILSGIAMGADPGYAFGIIIYGAGFIPDSEGNLTAKAQPPEFKEKLLKTWDPSIWVPKIKVPTFWINGTNDVYFPLETWQRSVDVSGGTPLQLTIPSMPHGHQVAWTLVEMTLFASDVVQGKRLPAINHPALSGNAVKASISGGGEGASATLSYTRDTGPNAARQWETIPATIVGSAISASVPEGVKLLFFTLTAKEGVRCSSPLLKIQ